VKSRTHVVTAEKDSDSLASSQIIGVDIVLKTHKNDIILYGNFTIAA